MPSVSAVDPQARIGDAVAVVGLLATPDGPRLAPGAEPVDAALGGTLLAALEALGARGKADEMLRVPTLGTAPFPLVIATGLGAEQPDAEQLDAEQVRRAVGAAARSAGGAATLHVAIGGAPAAAAEGALLGGYRFDRYRSPQSAGPRRIRIAATGVPRGALRRAQTIAEAVNLARDLVNTPPNDLYPAALATRAADAVAELGVRSEILDERALRRGRYGGILAVGGGSARPPRLLRLTYRPARPRATLALVGKGITFDTGGLNLKHGPSMGWMKSDMGGAAAVVGAIAAAARLRLPVELIATLPLAENMVSGAAYRPSDVVTMRGGRTVEIADTDAEGRVVLADAITRAAEDGPDALLEISTLTGGQVAALGLRVIGAMGEPAFRDRVVAAGRQAGELLWPMPLPAQLRAGLDSPVADLVNVPGDRWGSMLVGGLFLQEFVPDGLPWAHLDIAGPAFNPGGPHGYTPKGGTGAGVRTLLAAAESLG